MRAKTVGRVEVPQEAVTEALSGEMEEKEEDKRELWSPRSRR